MTAEGKKPDDTAASFYDYEDAFVVEELEYDDEEDEAILKTVDNITMQRWRFSATVSGRVYDHPATTPKVYLNSVEVKLTIPVPGLGNAIEAKDITRSRTVGESTSDGYFDLGTIRWAIKDVKALGGDIDAQKDGSITMELKLDGSDPAAGDKNSISPDVALTLELGQ